MLRACYIIPQLPQPCKATRGCHHIQTTTTHFIHTSTLLHFHNSSSPASPSVQTCQRPFLPTGQVYYLTCFLRLPAISPIHSPCRPRPIAIATLKPSRQTHLRPLHPNLQTQRLGARVDEGHRPAMGPPYPLPHPTHPPVVMVIAPTLARNKTEQHMHNRSKIPARNGCPKF